MKIAVTADWHIGVTTYGVLDSNGRNSRLTDVERTLKKIYEYCRREKVDCLIHAGDIFHTNKPTPDEQLIFFKFLFSMSQAGIPSRYIIGNHDHNSQLGKSDALLLFRNLKLAHVRIFNLTEAVQEFGCNFIYFPYAGEEPNFTDMVVPGMPNILVCHSHLQGAVVGAEPFEIKSDKATKFNEIPVSAVFAGHFHKPQVLGKSPLAFYPGSIQAVDFNERMDVKGIVVVDTDTMGYEPVGFKTRRLFQIDLTSVDDPLDPHLPDCKNAIVKVNINVGEADAHKVDEVDIRGRLLDADAHSVAGINVNVLRESVTRDPEIKIDAGVRSNFLRYIKQRDFGDLSGDIEVRGCDIINKCASSQ